MTASLPPGPRGPLISVEGISGAGKTYLTRRLARGTGITAIEAFSERAHAGPGTLGDQLLRALITAAHGEHFLRAGHPGTETVLLIAVKTFDFTQCLPLLMRGEAVVQGRSVDSIAVYQSLITYPDDFDRAHVEALAILAIAAQWRPMPDLTILIADDVPTAIGRAAGRIAFAHEAFFDYAYAQRHIRSGRSLLDLLRSSEQHLFRRGQVRQILTLEREQDFGQYLRDVRGVLSALVLPTRRA